MNNGIEGEIDPQTRIYFNPNGQKIGSPYIVRFMILHLLKFQNGIVSNRPIFRSTFELLSNGLIVQISLFVTSISIQCSVSTKIIYSFRNFHLKRGNYSIFEYGTEREMEINGCTTKQWSFIIRLCFMQTANIQTWMAFTFFMRHAW